MRIPCITADHCDAGDRDRDGGHDDREQNNDSQQQLHDATLRHFAGVISGDAAIADFHDVSLRWPRLVSSRSCCAFMRATRASSYASCFESTSDFGRTPERDNSVERTWNFCLGWICPDCDRLLHDRSIRDLDLLEAIRILLAAARPRVNAGAQGRGIVRISKVRPSLDISSPSSGMTSKALYEGRRKGLRG